ncbi:high-affinity nickel-transporter [Streptomyces himastatinicus ATCC 53653]|uniref:Nickel/cobalt efflux system n=1 Tax=Streptomyces himastatinicus ATCC 53653 TaxID=457427 RepID=D9WIV6_9ACTN|nr:high-affinity nickel-transporter [Streptomyces himastatinicus]EFL27609.1 high-affinity nickel-transporter [Streptomyces himastatinicus ATCC 53653]
MHEPAAWIEARYAGAANRFQAGFAEIGGVIGTLVSGVFLYAIAALNLAVLRGIVRTWREAKAGRHEPEELEQLLADRGLMNRVFKGRYNRFIEHSWQHYFVGLLFGLGFDTATQVGALGLAAGSAADGTRGRPPAVVVAHPHRPQCDRHRHRGDIPGDMDRPARRCES